MFRFCVLLAIVNAVLSSDDNKFSVEPKILKPEGRMPVIGLGTWQAAESELEAALEVALSAGYRHIDTANTYKNEKVIGKVLNRWLSSGKVKREDLFIVSKLPPGGNRPDGVPKYLNKSLEALQLDYLDVYLIHWPVTFIEVENDPFPIKDGNIMLDKTTDHVATWKAMEAQVDAGKAKAIGLSNFNITQVQRVLDNARIKPANLQIELHAYHQQVPMVDFCKKNNIAVTAYSPLGSAGRAFKQVGLDQQVPKLLHNPVVLDIAKKHNKSPAQVLLRHAVQKGLVVIPRSKNEKHLRENLDISNFKLDSEYMQQLNDLDKGETVLVDFGVFPGVKEHPEYPF